MKRKSVAAVVTAAAMMMSLAAIRVNTLKMVIGLHVHSLFRQRRRSPRPKRRPMRCCFYFSIPLYIIAGFGGISPAEMRKGFVKFV